MRKQSKRACVEALGWTLTPIPYHWPEGAIWNNPATGSKSPAHDDYKDPAGWIMTPPPGRFLAPRQFDGCSPNAAVRWAYDQATAQKPSPEAGGVARLTMLAAAAQSSGVILDGDDHAPPAPALPDMELLNLCREIAGCDRIAEAGRDSTACPWNQPIAHRMAVDRMMEACRTKRRLLPRVLELNAITPAGALAKAQVVLTLFANAQGQRAAAVRALVADITAVLAPSAPGRIGA